MPSFSGRDLETGTTKKVHNLPCGLLYTGDIEGARSRPAPAPSAAACNPIPGTSARRLIPADVRRRNDYGLNTTDIFNNAPQVSQFHTGRATNPLEPVYATASYRCRPYTPFRHLVDSLKTSDIPGTSSTPLPQRIRAKPPPEIELSCPRSTVGRFAGSGYFLRTNDICTAQGERGFSTLRRTDPLSPKYQVAGAPPGNGPQYLTLGGENHPKSAPKGRKSGHADFSLKTKDIEGCCAKPPFPLPSSRRSWGQTCSLADMPFAAPVTKHATTRHTRRTTDPTNPRYPPLERKAKAIALPIVL